MERLDLHVSRRLNTVSCFSRYFTELVSFVEKARKLEKAAAACADVVTSTLFSGRRSCSENSNVVRGSNNVRMAMYVSTKTQLVSQNSSKLGVIGGTFKE